MSIDIKTIHGIKDNLAKELDKYESKYPMTASDLDIVYKLSDSIKNLCKISEMEEEGESYGRGSSYGRGRSYGDDSYMGGYSGRRYSRDDGYSERRGYSRADAKDEMMNQLGEMMSSADEHQRMILKNAMRELEK